ncbi:MAG: DUF4384 domain-containing protein [Thermoanaerobaculia bacterium]
MTTKRIVSIATLATALATFASVASSTEVGSISGVSVANEGRSDGIASSADPSDDVFGFTYWIELIEAPGAAPVRVNDQRIFKSGERIRLHFQANSMGAVTIIQVGESGTSSVLFPSAASHLTDNVLRAGVDRALPSEKAWFKFDEHPGKEKLLVLFARSQAELDHKFPIHPQMDERTTSTLIETAKSSSGSKGFVLESEESESTVSNATGAPLIMEIDLKHQ